MKIKTIITILALSLTTGCAYHTVYVNTYKETNITKDFTLPATSFSVREIPGVKNQVLESRIKTQIEASLKEKGFTLAPVDTADYLVDFDYSLEERDYPVRNGFEFSPFLGFGSVFRSRHALYSVSTGYSPSYYSRQISYAALLSLGITENSKSAAAGRQIWFGQAGLMTDNSDLRDSIDYLTKGIFSYFGTDVSKAKVTLRRKK